MSHFLLTQATSLLSQTIMLGKRLKSAGRHLTQERAAVGFPKIIRGLKTVHNRKLTRW